MPQVKEIYDYLPVELKRSFILSLHGENGQETEAKESISRFLQSLNLDGANMVEEFLELLLEDMKKEVAEKRMSGEQNDLLLKQKVFQDTKDKAEKIEKEHLAAERARVVDVVRRHKELHPTETTEQCPVSLDDIECGTFLLLWTRHLSCLLQEELR